MKYDVTYYVCDQNDVFCKCATLEQAKTVRDDCAQQLPHLQFNVYALTASQYENFLKGRFQPVVQNTMFFDIVDFF